MAEAESEFQVLQEIYGADFVALSEAECTIRLAEPWRKVVLLINVQDSYPATPAKVTLADDASEQLSPESAIALLDFLEATSAEHAGETALFTVVCEAQEYLSSQEQASGATASAPPTQSASQASTVSSKSHADAPVVANATSDGAASSNVKAESTASQLTSTASPSEPVPLQSGTPAVCRFFKKGQCKFGDSCLNLHPGAVGKKSRAASAATTTTTAAAATPASNSSEMTATEPSAPGKGSSASAEGGKKTPMRQVVDVIHRIQWDDDLPTEHFKIGYLDRFVGIIEKPFAAFSWEDLASVDSRTVLAVPKHRFQYIKYRDEIVWDKRVQLDNFFGSRGDGTTIADVLKRHASNAPKPAVSAAASSSGEAQLTFEDDLDDDGDEGETSKTTMSHRTGPLRPNFFVGIRVTEAEIVAAAETVQQSIVAGDPRLADGVLSSTALHVTVCMLRIASAKDADRVKAVLTANQKHFMALFSSGGLRISGVGNFRGRVVFASVELTPELARLNQVLLQVLSEAGVATPGNHEGFTPHMTLVKLSRPMCRAMGDGAHVEPALYAQFSDLDFGRQAVDCLHVCSMTEPKSAVDGFYVRMTTASLGLAILVPSLLQCLQMRIERLRAANALSADVAADMLAALQATGDARLEQHSRLVKHLMQLSLGGTAAQGTWRFLPGATSGTSTTASTAPVAGCVYVLRGLPGSGKSRLAEALRSQLGQQGAVRVCCADEYFVSSGGTGERDVDSSADASATTARRYDFSSQKIRDAHAYCLDLFMEALNAGIGSVIVDNTHVQRWQYTAYLRLAAMCGYDARIVQLPCGDAEMARRFCERGQHKVPLPAVLRMFEVWEEDSSSHTVQPVLKPSESLDVSSITANSAAASAPQLPSTFFAAIFMSQQSRRQLLRAYPPTHLDNVPEALHVTLIFQPTVEQAVALPLGKTVTVTVRGCADDGRNQAVSVRIMGDAVKSANACPHITISFTNKSLAKYSNDMLEQWLASGKPLQHTRELLLSGTVGCMITTPPFDDLSVITDSEHLRHVLTTPPPRTASPAVLSETAEARHTVETIYIYDFDGTLLDTVGPTEGTALYEKLTGTKWPEPGYLAYPQSLQPPLPLRPGPLMRSFRQHSGRPHTAMVVLTGRQAETMYDAVAAVLRQFNVVPDQLICQPCESPHTASYKEEAIVNLIAKHGHLKKIVFYDDLPANLAACERLTKRYPALEWGVVDASTHEAPAKRYKDPLSHFVKAYGSLAKGPFRSAVSAVLEFLSTAWASLLTNATSDGGGFDEQQACRLVIPFGSVVLGRCSDLDLCVVASSDMRADHMEWMKRMAGHLEQCGLDRVHRGFSSRCPRLRCVVPLSTHAPIEVDIVFAILPPPSFQKLMSAEYSELPSIADMFSCIPKADTASHIALGGPLFAEEVLAVVNEKCSMKVFSAVTEAIVLLLKASNVKSNALHYPRTFHMVKLLAQIVASAPSDQTGSVTKLFSAFVRKASSMGKAQWSKLCREFVPEAYYPALEEMMGSMQAVLKRPQDVTLDTFVTAFSPEKPRLALLDGGFAARLAVSACNGQLPSSEHVWKTSVLLEARFGTFVRALLDRGFLFQPDCRPVVSNLLPGHSDRSIVLIRFAGKCLNSTLDARATMQSELTPLLSEISGVLPDGFTLLLYFDS
eukprot:scpid7455/ scgid0808/ Leukocyte receptor cluster member 9